MGTATFQASVFAIDPGIGNGANILTKSAGDSKSDGVIAIVTSADSEGEGLDGTLLELNGAATTPDTRMSMHLLLPAISGSMSKHG